MSRQASPKTAFIRNLLKANPDLTHADARPLLKKEGFDIAPDSGDEFEKESNYFNVTKYNWGKLLKSRKGGGRKPTVKNTKARTAAKRPKHRVAAKVTHVRPKTRRDEALPSDAVSALGLVESHGGVTGAQKRITALQESIAEAQAEITKIEAAVESVVALKKRLTKAA
jgi:hypothetical protein